MIFNNYNFNLKNIQNIKHKRLVFSMILIFFVLFIILMKLCIYFIDCRKTGKVSFWGEISAQKYLEKYDGEFEILRDETVYSQDQGLAPGTYNVFRYVYDKKKDVEFYIRYSDDMFGSRLNLEPYNDTYYESLLIKEARENLEQFFEDNHYNREFEIIFDEDYIWTPLDENEKATIYNTTFRVVFYLYSDSEEDTFIDELEKNVYMEI